MPLYIPYNCTVVFVFKRCCIIHAVWIPPTSHLHVDTTVVNGWNFLRITYMFELRLIFQAIQRVGIGDSVRFAINRARGLYTVILSYTLYDNLLTVYTRYVPIFRFICIITYSVKLPYSPVVLYGLTFCKRYEWANSRIEWMGKLINGKLIYFIEPTTTNNRPYNDGKKNCSM